MDLLSDFFNYSHSFIVGNTMIIAGAILTIKEKLRVCKYTARLLFVLGAMLITFSSIPISNHLFRFQIIMIIFLMITLSFGSRTLAPAMFLIRLFILGTCGLSIHSAVKSHEVPIIPQKRYSNLFIIGDKISSQRGSWAEIVKDKSSTKVTNLSDSDNDLRTSLDQAELISSKDSLIMVQLGMREVKSEVEPKIFSEDLRELLRELTRGNRTVVMFELPTSIMQKKYLHVQRGLVDSHNIYSIPRRHMFYAIDKLSTSAEDGELSKKGHEYIASIVLEMLSE